MAALMPLKDAQNILFNAVQKCETETIDIASALGRIAALNVASKRDQPAADMSAMDGYAVRYDAHINSWDRVGECKAGAPPCDAIGHGQAARIFTGALLPDGADTIIIQEHVTRENDKIIYSADAPIIMGQNIRRKGGDFSKDDIIIKSGTRLNPAHLGHIIAAGHGQICVYKVPKIAIISTGDELRNIGDSCDDYQIPASNGPMIAALLDGYNIAFNAIVRDDLDAITSCIKEHEACDVIVTIGGASVGDHDLILPALQSLGAEIDFMKVAIKPGKPIMHARLGHCHIIALPGNPSSAYVTAILFLLPLLRYISGMSDHLPPIRKAITSDPLAKTGPRAEFLRAVENDGFITPFASQDSGKLSTLSAANALIIRDSESEKVGAGEPIYYIPINHL